jgi:hypothetical protein
VAPQSGAIEKFYFTVYYITLNSNCEAQRVYKNLKSIVEDRVKSRNKWKSDLSAFFYFKEKLCLKVAK